jgi:hypothetical protein
MSAPTTTIRALEEGEGGVGVEQTEKRGKEILGVGLGL